jgi:antirestriction protein
MNETPRIYVASLSDYNSGNLLGAWIDANQSADEIRTEIQAMLATSREPVAEEWAIHDFEGFSPIRLSEYEDLETVAELAELIAEHGDIFAHLYAHENDLDRAKGLMEEGYHGEWESLADYAEDYLDQSGTFNGMPDLIRQYFDFESYAHDLDLNGDVFTIDIGGKVHVFDGNL